MTALEMLENGDRWTDEITRFAMPILLWCAKNGKTITYGDLEKEIARRHSIDIQQVKTKYGHPAGKVGDIIFEVAEEMDEDIPPINAIIIRKDTRLPSKGVDGYIKKFLKKNSLNRLSKSNRDEITKEVMKAVLTYPRWQQVAEHLGYKILQEVLIYTTNDDSTPINVPAPKPIGGGGGESEAHKKLKNKIANSPKLFLNFGKFGKGEEEYFLRSGDEVDVVFKSSELILAVEVKAGKASESELVRGVYQCVKYRATLRAMQLADGDLPNAQSVLATAIPLKGEVKRLAKRLQIEWLHVDEN